MTADLLRYLTYLLFNCLHFLTLDYELCAEGAQRDELARYGMQGDAFLLFLSSSHFFIVIWFRRSGAATPHIVFLDENGLRRLHCDHEKML